MDFNFSMDLSPRPAIDPNAPLYASLPGAMANLGGGECVLRAADGESHVMTVQVLQALDQCRAFAPLAEHIAKLQRGLPKVPAEAIRRVLDGLIERRLLLAERDFVTGLADAAASKARTSAAPRVFITGGLDPVAQFDALGAGGICDQLPGADWLWLGTDAADASAAVQAASGHGIALRPLDLGAAVAGVQRRLGLSTEQRQILSGLIGAGTGTAITPAQGFNLRLLLSAGRTAATLSRGQQWPMHRHPEFLRGLELRPQAEYPLRFYADENASFEVGAAVSGAQFAQQFGALGAGVGDLLKVPGDAAWAPGDLRGVAIGELPARLDQARVVAIELGVFGVAASGDREPWFLLDRVSRAQLTEDRGQYLRYLEQGRAWAGVRRATLAQRSEREPFAVDARSLPGFAPVAGRDHALGFSVLTRLAQPQAQVLRLPAAWRSSGPSPAPLPIGKTARQPSITQFIADFLESRLTDIHAESSAERFHAGAQLLADLAAASDAHLIEFTAEYLQFVRSSWIGALQRVAEEAGADAPVYWLADLRAIVTVNGRAVVESALPALADLPPADSAAALASALRSALRAEAERMRLWPLVWQRAGECASADRHWFG
ncbi:MAG: hypothetical protein AB7V26_11790 [Lysobacterales bacterium]